ncbi:MAG: HAD family phosphatase [Pyrinomonadaceae bacterium]|nr:HAD family phosphatase [Sphingobacteriaceae bacterium]
MKHIKNIIFDYGNVIFQIDFQKAQNTFTDLGVKNVETFFAHSGHDPLFSEFEKGDITAVQFRDGIRRITQKPELSDQEIDTAWTSLLIGVPPINHEILLKAKKQYRTFLLSNINEIHLNYIHNYLQREHQIESNAIFFEKVYYSHLVRKRKPNRDIFEHVLTDSKLAVSETLFIDDSPQHLKTAHEMGFETHLITKDDSLEKYMYRSGLLT